MPKTQCFSPTCAGLLSAASPPPCCHQGLPSSPSPQCHLCGLEEADLLGSLPVWVFFPTAALLRSSLVHPSFSTILPKMPSCPAAAGPVLDTDNTTLLPPFVLRSFSGCAQLTPILGSLLEASQQKYPCSTGSFSLLLETRCLTGF